MQQASEKADDYCGLVLTYRINDIYFCVPVEQVEAVIEPPHITIYPQAPDYVAGAFQYRNEVALAVRLRSLLNLPEAQPGPRRDCLLMVRINGKPVGYWIDEIKGMSDSGKGVWSDIPPVTSGQAVNKALRVGDYVYLPLDLQTVNNINEIGPILDALKHEHLLAEAPEPELTGPPQLEAEKETIPIQAEPANDAPAEAQPENTLEPADEEEPEDSGLIPANEAVAPVADDAVPTTEVIEDTTQEAVQDTVSEQGHAIEPSPEQAVPDSETVLEEESSVIEPNTDEGSVEEESPQLLSDEIGDAVETEASMEEEANDIKLPPDEALSFEIDLEQAISAVEADMDEGLETEGLPSVFSSELTDTDEIIQLAEDDVGESVIDEESPPTETLSSELDIEQESPSAEVVREEGQPDEEPASLLAEDTANDIGPVAFLEEAVDEQSEADESAAEEVSSQESGVEDEVLHFEPSLDEAPQSESVEPPSEELLSQEADIEGEELAAEPSPDEVLQAEPAESPSEEVLNQAADVGDEVLEVEPSLEESLQAAEEIPTDEDPEDLNTAAETEVGYEEEPEITVAIPESEIPSELVVGEDGATLEPEVQDEIVEPAPATEQLDQDEHREVLLATDMTDETETVPSSAIEQAIQEEPSVSDLREEHGPSEVEAGALEDLEDETSPSLLDETEIEESEAVFTVEQNRAPVVDEQVLMAELPDDGLLEALEFSGEIPPAEAGPELEDHEDHVGGLSLPESSDLDEVEEPAAVVTSVQPEAAEISPFIHTGDQAADSREYDLSLGEELSEEVHDTDRPVPSLGRRIRRLLIQIFAVPLILGIISGAIMVWWKLQDWPEKERLVMQLPPILRNEVAPMYSSKVSFIVPERGPDRLIIELPQYEVRIISADKVSAILLKQREEISISMHMVKKGDTLSQLLQENLQDVERYPDLLMLNNRPGEIRVVPGDVMTIMDKQKIP